MAKIIIIGHCSTDCELIEDIFHQKGMVSPRISKISEFTPQEITNYFIGHKQSQESGRNEDIQRYNKSIQFYGGAQLKNRRSSNKRYAVVSKNKVNVIYSSEYVAPLWKSLGTDLMLANIRNEFWGWSDSQAVNVVDYWAQIDPDIKFIFIYGNLEDLLFNLGLS